MSTAPGGIAGAASSGLALARPKFDVSQLRSAAWVAYVRRLAAWLRRQPVLQPKLRRLQVQETVQLGDKRFVSILRVDGEQFLIAGSAGGVTLLASMHPDAAEAASFAAVLETELATGERQACA